MAMSIAECNAFYEKDEERYTISKNKDFLKWYRKLLKWGYTPFTTIKDLQSTIDFIVTWYEFKYPERMLNRYCGVGVDYRFEGIKEINEQMDFRQLCYRLPHISLLLLEGDFRHKYHFGIKDVRNAFVNDVDIKFIDVLKYIGYNDVHDIDTNELAKAVRIWNTDIVLRKKVLSLVSLKLLYSRSSQPEASYIRAKLFVEEFNKAIPSLHLDTKELDLLIGDKNEPFEMFSNDIKKCGQKKKVRGVI